MPLSLLEAKERGVRKLRHLFSFAKEPSWKKYLGGSMSNIAVITEGNNFLWVFFNIPRKLRITYVQFFVLGIYFEKLSGYTDNIKRQNC